MKYLRNILLIIIIYFIYINGVYAVTKETQFTCTYTSNVYSNPEQYVQYGIDYTYQDDNLKYWYLKNESYEFVRATQTYIPRIDSTYGFTLFYKETPPQNALLNQSIIARFTNAGPYFQEAYANYEKYFADYDDYEPFSAQDFCPKSSVFRSNDYYEIKFENSNFTPKKKSGSTSDTRKEFEFSINGLIEDKMNLNIIINKNIGNYTIKARLNLSDLNWTSSITPNIFLNQTDEIELPIYVDNYYYTYKIRLQSGIIKDMLNAIENNTYQNKYYVLCNPDIGFYYVVSSTSDEVCKSLTEDDEHIGNLKPDDYDDSMEMDPPQKKPSTTTKTEEENCKAILGDPKDPKYPAYWFQMILDIMKYAAIVALLVLSTMDFIKASVEDDKEALKKAVVKTGKRFVYAVLIFFLPIIVNVLMKLLGAYGTCGLG